MKQDTLFNLSAIEKDEKINPFYYLHSVWDARGMYENEFADYLTIVFIDGTVIGCNDDFNAPQGIYQHGELDLEDINDCNLGKQIQFTDLSKALQKKVLSELKEYVFLYKEKRNYERWL